MSILRDDAFDPDDVLEVLNEPVDDIDGLIDPEDKNHEKERWVEKLEFTFSLPIEQALTRFCA